MRGSRRACGVYVEGPCLPCVRSVGRMLRTDHGQLLSFAPHAQLQQHKDLVFAAHVLSHSLSHR